MVYDNTIELDTYYNLFNATFGILVSSQTGTNLQYFYNIPDVFIGNFFGADVTVNAPIDLGNDVYNVTWSAVDRNVDDINYYQVWLSNDGGVSYQRLARNLTDAETFYVWDSSGFLERDNYIVRIRAFSLDFTTLVDGEPLGTAEGQNTYWPGDFGDGFSPEFSAGDVPPPTEPPTTSPPTTTTPPTTTPVTPGFDPLLIGLIGGIGIGVVILLILFLIRKK